MGEAGGPRGLAVHPAVAFFYKSQKVVRSSQERLLGPPSSSPSSSPNPSPFPQLSTRFRKGVDCVSFLPGIFLFPRTPCLWLPLYQSSQKIVKGARLRCASASGSQSILPLLHLFYERFSRPYSNFSVSFLSLVCGTPPECSHRSLLVPRASNGPAVGA